MAFLFRPGTVFHCTSGEHNNRCGRRRRTQETPFVDPHPRLLCSPLVQWKTVPGRKARQKLRPGSRSHRYVYPRHLLIPIPSRRSSKTNKQQGLEKTEEAAQDGPSRRLGLRGTVISHSRRLFTLLHIHSVLRLARPSATCWAVAPHRTLMQMTPLCLQRKQPCGHLLLTGCLLPGLSSAIVAASLLSSTFTPF
jgi:hypothetical protein